MMRIWPPNIWPIMLDGDRDSNAFHRISWYYNTNWMSFYPHSVSCVKSVIFYKDGGIFATYTCLPNNDLKCTCTVGPEGPSYFCQRNSIYLWAWHAHRPSGLPYRNDCRYTKKLRWYDKGNWPLTISEVAINAYVNGKRLTISSKLIVT